MTERPKDPPVISVTERDKSRREVTIGTPDMRIAHIVLEPGMLGTDLGAEVLRRASDPGGATINEDRGKRRKNGGA